MISRILLKPNPIRSTACLRLRLKSSSSSSNDPSHYREHAIDKDDKYDPQTRSSNKGHEAKKEDQEGKGAFTDSTATAQKDNNSKNKILDEFPEAPDSVGLQDERGKRV